jgi:hypothetical protein
MNRIVRQAAVIATTSLAAFAVIAQEASPAPEIDNFLSAKTRAEVQAETVAASRQGLIARNDADVQRIAGAQAGTAGRNAVRAEPQMAQGTRGYGYGEV